MKEELIRELKKRVIKDDSVLHAFQETPREAFVLKHHKDAAYEDRPLPILAGQTISQPTTVIIMTQALEVKQGMKILEVGAGSGYQAAILSKLVGKKGKVIATEIIPELVDFARKNLEKTNCKNVKVIYADGSLGYEKEKPYDRIIVTAASPLIPDPLLKQLKVNGILVIPVGSLYSQSMLQVKKKPKGKQEVKHLGQFLFVPLKGKYGRENV